MGFIRETQVALIMAEEKKPEEVLGTPMQEYYLEVDEVGAGVERYYFWLLNFLKSGQPSGVKCDEVIKVKDVYGATETSSYFGSVEQRKGLQQDRVSQYMATIGKMVKDLFQIVRELRIMDERAEYYKEGDNNDVALKSIWIDMVEGGAKNPTSVLGLGSQVGFAILPDLFFSVHPAPKKAEEIESSIKEAINNFKDKGKTTLNRKIEEVLGRKLAQYLIWKVKTEQEIRQRRGFMLKYLRQHYNIIKMYMDWVRPYLRNLKRLQMKQDPESPYLVSAFESSTVELELIGKWEMKDSQKKEKAKYQAYIRIEFFYVTIPQMAYQQEYQRGAIHTGKSIIKIKSYSLEESKIKEYKQALEEQDLDLLEAVTGSLDALKDELKKYLKEAGEPIFKEDIEKVMKETNETEAKAKEALEKTQGDSEKAIKFIREGPKQPSFNPFEGFTFGFKDIFKMPGKKEEKKEEKKIKLKSWQSKDQEGDAKKRAKSSTYLVYDIFKKGNRLFAW